MKRTSHETTAEVRGTARFHGGAAFSSLTLVERGECLGWKVEGFVGFGGRLAQKGIELRSRLGIDRDGIPEIG